MTKRVETRPAEAALIAYRVLLVVFLVLLVIFLAGTIYGLAARGRGESAEQPEAAEAAPGESMFTALGTIRVSTAGIEPASLVISVVFPYNHNDRPFFEELVSRIGDFKTITVEYLGSFSAEELQEADTAAINAELLGRYNALLKLGQIRELYFPDFIWL